MSDLPPSSLRRIAIAVAAICGATLVPAGPAHAAKVTSLKPWKKTNTYLARADLDGRKKPRVAPVAKVDHVRAGQWIRVQCQTRGQSAYGSRIWIKTGGLYVPDHYVKTYTDGFIRGVPRCGRRGGKKRPSRAELRRAVRAVAFERVYGSNYRIYKARHPKAIDWDNNGCSVPIELMRAAGAAFPGGLGFAQAAQYYSGVFQKSCDRHDFGYRNYGDNSGGLELNPSDAMRERIDKRFLSNMKHQCDVRFSRKYVEAAQRQLCKEVADEFHAGVRLGGGSKF